MVKRKPIGLRLSHRALAMLEELAESLGITKTGILEMVIRDEFKRRKLKLKEATNDKN